MRFDGLPRARPLGVEVPVATSRAVRLLGLSFLGQGEAGEGLLIPHCHAVHTWGMRFALDLVFLDDGGTVVALRRAVPPRRFARCAEASAVLELPAP